MQKMEIKPGLLYYSEAFSRSQQQELLQDIRTVTAQAPLYCPTMPKSGKAMSVLSTNCGRLGWYSDKEGGYRYQSHHPVTGQSWPPLPASFRQIWQTFSGHPDMADCGLVNYYGHSAKMGLHKDTDEQDFSAPVISLSLGDQASFLVGGLDRRDQTHRLKLSSGDLVILGGEMRKAYHGIARLYPETSTLVREGGRFNITLRKAG